MLLFVLIQGDVHGRVRVGLALGSSVLFEGFVRALIFRCRYRGRIVVPLLLEFPNVFVCNFVVDVFLGVCCVFMRILIEN